MICIFFIYPTPLDLTIPILSYPTPLVSYRRTQLFRLVTGKYVVFVRNVWHKIKITIICNYKLFCPRWRHVSCVNSVTQNNMSIFQVLLILILEASFCSFMVYDELCTIWSSLHQVYYWSWARLSFFLVIIVETHASRHSNTIIHDVLGMTLNCIHTVFYESWSYLV